MLDEMISYIGATRWQNCCLPCYTAENKLFMILEPMATRINTLDYMLKVEDKEL